MELCSSEILKTLLFDAFAYVFVYAAILLGGFVQFSTEYDCFLLRGLLLGTLLRYCSTKLSVLSDCILFSTFIGLVRVRVFLYFPFFSVTIFHSVVVPCCSLLFRML